MDNLDKVTIHVSASEAGWNAIAEEDWQCHKDMRYQWGFEDMTEVIGEICIRIKGIVTVNGTMRWRRISSQR
jgi:hypothetical protein